MWIVELEPGVWLAPWEGDPGRTLVMKNARKFSSYVQAFSAVVEAKGWRKFDKFMVVPVQHPTTSAGAPLETASMR